ncbi:MAG TPA: serine/threonine-protein kinase [Streptosporangiaceae bacterium]|nr:serine/threonine-protein kinase [Streptosporangiaceae bacterium]
MEVGTELAGRFVLEKVLESGGMGDVWQGTDRQLRRPVAIKVMQDRLADPRRFEREAQIAARLQHPGITVVYDFGTYDGVPYIVMELLAGQNLADMLDQAPRRQLPVGMAVSLIIQAAKALQAAHADRIIHRDLKPANLFLQDRGGLKICDFGIARIADAPDGLTSGGYVLGTAQYMSPEQCEGAEIDERSDLYSLGCVLYELLTGRPPFSAGGQRAIMNQHMNMPPVSPRTLRPDIPRELDSIVLNMLAKDPGDRPADADVVAARLEAVLAVRTSATGQTASHEKTRSPYPASAEDGESSVSRKHAQAQRMRQDPRIAAKQRDPLEPSPEVRSAPQAISERGPIRPQRPAVGTSPSRAALPPPQLQVAPSSGSWSLLAFDPSGRWLASADGDGTITLWDVASGLPVRSWSAEAHVLAMAAGPGNQLAVGGDDGCARIWDVERAALRGQFCGHVGGVQAVALDHSGIRLATGDTDGVVRLWDPRSGEPVSALRLAHCAVTALAFDPAAGQLAAGGDGSKLRVWDVGSPNKAILLAEPPYGEEATAIAFDAAGGQLAIGGADGELRVWDLGPDGHRWRSAHHDHDGGVLALAWNAPEGHWVSIGADGRLRAGDGDKRPVVERGYVRAAAVSAVSGRGAVIDDGSGRIHTFRIGDPGARQRLQGSDTILNGVAFGPSGELLIIGGTDGVLHLWDARLQTLRSAGASGYGIGAVAGAPGGRRVAVCREDGRVTVGDIAERSSALIEAWTRQCPELTSAVVFSPDGSRVAVAGDAVRVWRTEDGSACAALPESAQRTRGIAYDHTGRRLAAAGADGAVRVWDAAADVLLHTLVGHKGAVYAVAFSPSSGRLATAGADGTIRIWDPDRGSHLLCLSGWECRARVLAFSPADGTLVIGGTDGVVRFREPSSWTQTRAWPGHVHGITAMCFGPGGRRLATAGRDGTARIWDLATGSAELVLLPQRGRWAAVFADGTIRQDGDAAGLLWYSLGLSRQPPTQHGTTQ